MDRAVSCDRGEALRTEQGAPMTAEAIAKALGGRRVGVAWIARCPAHDDRKPSLSIRDNNDGKVLVRCHAGCDQTQVVEELRSRGLWHGKILPTDSYSPIKSCCAPLAESESALNRRRARAL